MFKKKLTLHNCLGTMDTSAEAGIYDTPTNIL